MVQVLKRPSMSSETRSKTPGGLSWARTSIGIVFVPATRAMSVPKPVTDMGLLAITLVKVIPFCANGREDGVEPKSTVTARLMRGKHKAKPAIVISATLKYLDMMASTRKGMNYRHLSG